ncbi:MAG: OadG family protein [Firmicutes bacterium]|nr:OadG family protein [Bacillota bacterium]
MSTGEIMRLAGLNTLLGMGTVFVVLLFISFIISLFKYIAPQTKAAPAAPAPVPAAPATEPVEEEEDDQELLVAVITAALHASMSARGEDPEGFVVRSIRRK